MESSRTAPSIQSAESGPQSAGLGRKASNLSAQDEFGDLYRTPTNNENRPQYTPTAAENKRKLAKYDPEEDENNWIHKDKLAQIERKELEEAGFRVPRNAVKGTTTSRSSSRARQEKVEEPPVEAVNGDDYDPYAFHPDAYPPDKRQRTISPRQVEQDNSNVLGSDFELRKPEEVAAEREINNRYSMHVRPSTSRIPVKKSSPLPVPSTFLERDSPLPRSRNGSGGGSGGPDDGSAGSQEADEPSTPPSLAPMDTTSSAGRSPPKARVPSKTNPSSGSRKASGPSSRKVSSQTSRQTSASSPTKARPPTSSGLASGRPSTSHARPEGDPPWIQGMYKPDPRLPPDQQMLPTHAKRMAQEQWEKEGKTGTVYDRDFRLLNSEQIEYLKPDKKPPTLNLRLPSKESLREKNDDELSWPLAPTLTTRASAATSNGRPGTSGTDHGGYSIMPSLSSPKHQPQSPTTNMPMSPKPFDVMRVQDPEAGGAGPEKKEKNGCCCIVM